MTKDEERAKVEAMIEIFEGVIARIRHDALVMVDSGVNPMTVLMDMESLGKCSRLLGGLSMAGVSMGQAREKYRNMLN